MHIPNLSRENISKAFLGLYQWNFWFVMLQPTVSLLAVSISHHPSGSHPQSSIPISPTPLVITTSFYLNTYSFEVRDELQQIVFRTICKSRSGYLQCNLHSLRRVNKSMPYSNIVVRQAFNYREKLIFGWNLFHCDATVR